jgi:5-methylcytosine-specific restriction protein A
MTARSLEEWVGKTPDVAIPPRVRLRIYDRCNGRCMICTRKVGGPLSFAFDHRTALINGGRHSESNLQILCTHCHAVKTGEDVAEKSKTYAIRSKHLGVKKSKRPFPKRHDPWGKERRSTQQ